MLRLPPPNIRMLRMSGMMMQMGNLGPHFNQQPPRAGLLGMPPGVSGGNQGIGNLGGLNHGGGPVPNGNPFNPFAGGAVNNAGGVGGMSNMGNMGVPFTNFNNGNNNNNGGGRGGHFSGGGSGGNGNGNNRNQRGGNQRNRNM
ncbi:protein suppressor of sable-like [Drosophila eugracilis]|uniref:protein suppressor of sable-like n=1 Tax=Drosophila eugracilis TaxID=29029 RepID=UPI001BD9BB1A|nr:protein suppressor of sable-like [Drosophila eugracilis]